MNVQKFLQILPTIFASSQNHSFLKLKQQLHNDISLNILELLNGAVSCLESEEVYCQVGCLPEASLIAALLNHQEVMAYAIDNFNDEDNLTKLEDYLINFNLENQVIFCQQGIEEFFQDLPAINPQEKIGIYYYNGRPNYREVLTAMMLVRPFLSEESSLIISNTNNEQVQQAISDFIRWQNPSLVQQLFNSQLNQNLDLDFGEGINILVWQSDNQKLLEKKITAQGLVKLNNLLENKKQKILLHVGCGPWHPEALPDIFDNQDWQEIRLDIDYRVQPDLVSSITDLSILEDNLFEGVYSSHNLEHIYDFEVPLALAEFKRVLKPGGLLMLKVPDLQIAAEWVARGDLEDSPLYNSPAGDVPAIWMFYGLGTTQPGKPYMAHKTGFTEKSIQNKMIKAGFRDIKIVRRAFTIIVYGTK